MTPRALRILVVEDDVAEAVGLTEVLKHLGHIPLGPVFTAESAVKMALETTPDLVIMDIRLPQHDGLWAARALIAQRPVGIIFITGSDDEALISLACQAGGLAYLVKPVGKRQLEAAVEVAWARFADTTNLRAQVSGMEEALATRKQVERAKGILMDRLGLTEDQAHRRLQKQARDTNQKLGEVAAAVIAAAGTLWVKEDGSAGHPE